jgi:hypothetical protein
MEMLRYKAEFLYQYVTIDIQDYSMGNFNESMGIIKLKGGDKNHG